MFSALNDNINLKKDNEAYQINQDFNNIIKKTSSSNEKWYSHFNNAFFNVQKNTGLSK